MENSCCTTQRPCLFHCATKVLAILGFLLVLTDVGLATAVSNLQQEVLTRQSTVNDDVRIDNLRVGIIKVIAKSAYDNKDQKLQDILTEQGIKQAPQKTQDAK